MISRNRRQLCKFRIVLHLRKAFALHHGPTFEDRILRRYLLPSLRLLYSYLDKDRQNQRHTKTKLLWFLRARNEKSKMKMKIVQTTEKVIYFQQMVKQYFGKKRLWEAQIYVEIDKERQKMRDFIKINMRG